MALKKITGFGHGEGQFKRLDNVYEILSRHSRYYDAQDEELDDAFYKVLFDTSKSSGERAELLM